MKRTIPIILVIAAIISCMAFPSFATNIEDHKNEVILQANVSPLRAPEYLRVRPGYMVEMYTEHKMSPNYKWLSAGDEMYVISYYTDHINYMWVYGRVSKGTHYGDYGWVIWDSTKVAIIQT